MKRDTRAEMISALLLIGALVLLVVGLVLGVEAATAPLDELGELLASSSSSP